eukprot:scaffold58592_cov17-Tisochrysis_lutea.AAC.1
MTSASGLELLVACRISCNIRICGGGTWERAGGGLTSGRRRCGRKAPLACPRGELPPTPFTFSTELKGMGELCGCRVIDTYLPRQGRVKPWGQPASAPSFLNFIRSTCFDAHLRANQNQKRPRQLLLTCSTS